MLSEALQRNAEHEARLSNIPICFRSATICELFQSFAPLRMTLLSGVVIDSHPEIVLSDD
jgi:hypothetical protein